MPIAVLCPGCDSRLNAPEAAAGKTVKCPKCKAPMLIPSPEADAGFDAVDEPAPPRKPAAVSTKPAAVKKGVTADDDDRPKKKRRPVDDEDEDDRPRKRKGKKGTKGGPTPAVLIGAIVGGVLLLGGGAFAAYWFGVREKPKETADGGGGGGGGDPGRRRPGGVIPSAGRGQSAINLKRIGLAMHNFNDVNGALPAGVYDSTGKVGLSWRVAILPYIEQEPLYKQFRLNEPWDSEHNKKLIPRMPPDYAAPGGGGRSGFTHYRAFTGPDTAFPPSSGQPGQPAKGLKLFAIADGTSNTALAVEAADPVEWTRPDELEYAPGKPLPRVGGVSGDGFSVLLGDGSTAYLKSPIAAEKLKAIITAKGGETADWRD